MCVYGGDCGGLPHQHPAPLPVLQLAPEERADVLPQLLQELLHHQVGQNLEENASSITLRPAHADTCTAPPETPRVSIGVSKPVSLTDPGSDARTTNQSSEASSSRALAELRATLPVREPHTSSPMCRSALEPGGKAVQHR